MSEEGNSCLHHTSHYVICILLQYGHEVFLLPLELVGGGGGGGGSTPEGIRLTVICDECCLENEFLPGTDQSHSTGPGAALSLAPQPGMSHLSWR